MASISLRVGLDLDKGMVGEVFDQDSGPLEVLEKIRGDLDVNSFFPYKWPGIGWKVPNFALASYSVSILKSN